jgi:phosphoethanolamine N-methyltransferase
MSEVHEDEYDDAMVAMLELIWGEGFMSPGGPHSVRDIIDGVDLSGKLVLDIGCGLGGVDIMLARDYGCHIIALDIEAPLLERARAEAEAAGVGERIDFRLVEPGPLTLDDASVDVVFGKDAWTQIPNKRALLGDIYRVLRPGGRLAAGDWCRGPDPFSTDMVYFFEVEGLTFNMETLDNYGALLGELGFVDTELTDLTAWYQAEARDEYERIKGPLNARMREVLGDEKAEHFVENWRILCVVIDNGELRPGRLRASKPQ